MKVAKILYTVAIFVITGLVIMFSMGCRMGFMNPLNILGTDGIKTVSDTVKTEEFKNIDVDANVVNFSIEEGDEYSVKYELPEELEPTIDVNGDTLRIKSRKDPGVDLKFFDFTNGIHTTKYSIKVIVPKGANIEDLTVLTNAGNIELDGRTFDDVDLNCNAGNVEMRYITCTSCKISTNAGNVQADKSDLGDLDLDTNAGNVDFDNTVMKNINIETDMGNIDLDDVTFVSGKIDTEVGNVEVDGEYDKLEAESEVGAISANSSKEDTVFDISTQIGSVSVNGKSQGRSYSN